MSPTSGPEQDVNTAPPRPAALGGPATDENAVEVGKYFMSLFPYAAATGDLDEWDALSGPSCTYCANVRALIAEIHTDGFHSTGGAFDLGYGSSALYDGAHLVEIDYRQYPSRTVDADGTVVEDFPDTVDYRAHLELIWSNGTWAVSGANIEEMSRWR